MTKDRLDQDLNGISTHLMQHFGQQQGAERNFYSESIERNLDYLERVADLFGLSPLGFRRLRAVHLGAEANDPYMILDVPHDADDAAVRSAWKIALSSAHPDRARARGLPSEFIEVAEAKSAAINEAFSTVMRERRELGLATAG